MGASRFNKVAYTVYQYILLLVLAGLLGWIYLRDGEVQQLILGVLVGRMIGIPLPEVWSHEKAWAYPAVMYPVDPNERENK